VTAHILTAAFVAGVATCVLMPVAMAVLRRLGRFDVPGQRSSHQHPTLRGGGIACLAAIMISVVLVTPRPGSLVVIGVLLLGGLGFADDLKTLAPVPRLVAQVVLGAWCAFGVRDLFPHTPWGVVGVCVVAVWVVGFTNVFNFMDGVNGISGFHALVGGIGYAVLAARHHDGGAAGLAAALAGAGACFLFFNFPTARVFLGDAGSYVLGSGLAMSLVIVWRRGATPTAALAPVLIYVVDAGTTMARRIARGVNPMTAHREHVYQRLTIAGWTHARVTLVVAGCSAVLTVAGIVVGDGSMGGQVAVWVVAAIVVAGYLAAPGVVRARSIRRREMP
jgi:UDP-N-acetylmuramyl pentapeptide phosphotransferase/UDP-N-acetylglucosamine-1-phosphate transferase